MSRAFVRKWILLALLIGASLIAGLKTAIGFFYFFFWFLVFVVLLSFLWALANRLGTRLELKRLTSSRLDCGDSLKIQTLVVNRGILPASALLVEDHLSCAAAGERVTRSLVIRLPPLHPLRLSYGCDCRRRGRYLLGPFTVYSFDPLGLFFFRRTYPLLSELYVYPKTFRISRFPRLSKGVMPWFGIETTRSGGDDDEFYGTREYRQGDPIKTIHWFSTALKNRLIVKQFQRQAFFRATVIFNLRAEPEAADDPESVNEYIIRIAASVSRYLVERGISLEMIAHAGELVHLPFNKGPEHLEDILKFLAVAAPRTDVSLGEMFEQFCRFIPDHSTLVVIMRDTDWEYLPQLLPLEKRNISLVPLVLATSTFRYGFDQRALLKNLTAQLSQAFNFAPVVISQGDNLEETFLRYGHETAG